MKSKIKNKLNNYILPVTCVPVKGYCRSVIYDLNRNDFNFIPNFLYYILMKIKNNEKLSKDEADIFFTEYQEFLLENEYIVDIPPNLHKNFNNLDKSWLVPYHIGFVFLKISTRNINVLNALVLDLEEKFFTRYLTFILEDCSLLADLSEFIKNYKSKTVQYYKIIITNFELSNDKNDILKLCEIERVQTIKLNINQNINYEDNIKSLQTTDKIIITNYENQDIYKLWEIVNPNNFTLNISMFMEAQKYNTFFNKKVFIDDENNFHLTYNFNNTEPTTLILDMIFNDEISLWKVKKDLIDVCKDCEFRYMCVDYRIPEQRDDKTWYFKSECTYNPYISKWEHEENYLDLESCGILCNKTAFAINNEKIIALQNEIWG